jgi:hypothetical protein
VAGRRHTIDSLGSTYEDCVRLLVGRFASLVHVPREQDFGIDFYVQPRVGGEDLTESVAELGSIQVKGGSASLKYGGVDSRGHWRHHELTWLRTLATPLYLARVDRACTAVQIFSLWPTWLIFWRQSVLPFQIEFTTQVSSTALQWREPVARPHARGAGKGDGKSWTVDLGRPLLQLTATQTTDAGSAELHSQVLRTWLVNDRANLMRFHQFIPVLTGITGWKPNSLAELTSTTWQFWGTGPGENIIRLCQTAAPLVVNLGVHLQWQNDAAAYSLVPLLQWLRMQGRLDQIGLGLLSGLESSRAAGLGPGVGIRRSTDSDQRPNKALQPRSRVRKKS